MATKDEFKFPDEIEDDKKQTDIEVEYDEESDEVKIEIEDATPPEDRFVEPLDEEAKKAWQKRFGQKIPGNIPSPVETINMTGGVG